MDLALNNQVGSYTIKQTASLGKKIIQNLKQKPWFTKVVWYRFKTSF